MFLAYTEKNLSFFSVGTMRSLEEFALGPWENSYLIGDSRILLKQ